MTTTTKRIPVEFTKQESENPVLNFRPGRAYRAYLVEFAAEWELSIGEAAKRLGIMATVGFSALAHYGYLHKITNATGKGPDAFFSVCDAISAALNTAAATAAKSIHLTSVYTVSAEARAKILKKMAIAAERGRPMEIDLIDVLPPHLQDAVLDGVVEKLKAKSKARKKAKGRKRAVRAD